MIDHELKPQPCPSCSKELDRATSVNSTERPDAGSITFCMGCGAMLKFEKDLSFSEITEERLTAEYGVTEQLYLQQLHVKVKAAMILAKAKFGV